MNSTICVKWIAHHIGFLSLMLIDLLNYDEDMHEIAPVVVVSLASVTLCRPPIVAKRCVLVQKSYY